MARQMRVRSKVALIEARDREERSDTLRLARPALEKTEVDKDPVTSRCHDSSSHTQPGDAVTPASEPHDEARTWSPITRPRQ
jgi:hypothetical protein